MELDSIFNSIRDIPYKIPTKVNEINNFCNCNGKVRKLKDLFIKKGIKSRYRICSFLRSKLNLPNKILRLPHEDIGSHVYLEVFIENKWIIIDPSWDKSLEGIFKVNYWNLDLNMEIAVNPISISSLEESERIMKTLNEKDTLKKLILQDLKINGGFYKAFNTYLDEKRFK